MTGQEDIRIRLENEMLEAQISLHGAELKSLKKKAKGTEYMWCADPAYWGRTSPVLFPFIGKVRDQKYRIGDTEYPMGQHGFAGTKILFWRVCHKRRPGLSWRMMRRREACIRFLSVWRSDTAWMKRRSA